MKKITLLLALFCASFTFAQTVYINEIDADQTSTDTEEFIEIATPAANTSLDGYVVVLFNGGSTDDASYGAFDLTGFSTDADGYLIIGSDAIAGAELSLGADNGLQNGADAVAIYQDDIANWENGTPATTTNLIDAIVYGTSDDDDVELLAALGETVQYDENLNGNKDTESLQLNAAGDAFCTALPTLRDTNVCPACTFVITDVAIACDSETSGTDSVTIDITYSGGGDETYTVEITSGGGVVTGDDPTTTANGVITLTDVSEDTTITLEITSTSCNVVTDIETPVCEAPNDIATIAALREATEGESYRLTGEALVTFTQDFRGQKFIEDATAAILIDDNDGIITTAYEIGDGMTNLRGTLGSFNGMIQFTPDMDPGAPSSTGNTINPQQVSITDLNNSPEDYESEYVQIDPAVMVDTSTNTTWITGEIYPLTNNDGSFNFRTSFFDADYIGSSVPTSSVFIAGIITEREAESMYYITARDADDASTVLSTNDFDQNAFAMFPNPANELLTIVSPNNGVKNVVIYDVTGKQVINTSTTGEVNIASLNSGLYIVTISEGTASATKKLVVR